ncbi:MAG TPA: S8 family serine peptidase [Cyclobacteriaceae bacterium]
MKILNTRFIWLILLLPFVSGYGQSNSKYFYYYQGNKIFLEPDKQTVAISWEGDTDINLLSSSLVVSKSKFSRIAEDHTRNTVITIDQKASSRKNLKTYYLEIGTDLSTLSDYERMIESYKTKPNVAMASPCFAMAGGKKMGLSNNLYVKLKTPSDVNLLYEQADKLKLEVLGHNEFMPLWFTLSSDKNSKVNSLQAANLLYETGLFESTEPAFIYHDLMLSSDPYFNNQWGLKNTGQYGSTYAGIDIKAEQAWGITTGATSIKVAVYDHGFEMNHPDLQANTFGTGYNAANGTTPAQVLGDHGTACAGIVGAVQNNNLGVSGVAPTSKLISVSINLLLSDPPQNLANGFNWAWQNGADVISNSWGGYAQSSIIDDAITNTLTNGRGGKGTVIVFAAGNENNTAIRYPGISNPSLLVVGALSPCGQRKSPSSCDGEAWGSCFGTQLDVMAPGVKIPTTDRQGTNGFDATDYFQTFNGTSSACPHVAGVAALVLSANPNLTVQQVTDIIEKSAQKVRTDLYSYTTTSGRPNGTWHNEMGYGLVDAYAAVLLANSTTCQASQSITPNVVAPYTDNRQASATITATNIINAGASANYHAGSSVTLSPGFRAIAGSKFRANVLGCTDTYSSSRIATGNVTQVSYEEIKNITAGEDIDVIVSPNPTSGILNIQTFFTEKRKVSILIYDTFGNRVYESSVKEMATEGHEVNLTGKASGLYIVHLKANNTVYKTKIILNK